jgi:polysaccharide biosynthesis protein PslG
MRWILAALAALSLAAPARATTMENLPAAGAVSSTDTIAVCQAAGGCGTTDPLKRATMSGVSTYIAGSPAPPKGVNLDHFQYDSSASQAQQIAIMQQLGVQWARIGIYQTQMDGSCAGGYIYYGNSDRAVTTLQNAGIKVLLYFAGTSSCDASGGTANNPPSDLTTSGYFLSYYVTQIVQHYAAMGMHNWEIWNEPDTAVEGSWTASQYATFACNAYNVIKTNDPSATVVAIGGSASGSTFLTNVYAAGFTSKCSDAISAHPYNPAYESLRVYNHDAWGAMYVGNASADITQAVMAANGDGNKPIWVTETGCSTSGTVGNFACTLQQQAQWVNDAFSPNNKFPNEGPVFWFDWNDGGTNANCTGPGVGTSNTCLGLLYNDYTIKPSGYAYQAIP